MSVWPLAPDSPWDTDSDSSYDSKNGSQDDWRSNGDGWGSSEDGYGPSDDDYESSNDGDGLPRSNGELRVSTDGDLNTDIWESGRGPAPGKPRGRRRLEKHQL
ncbi:hypothetical protein K432DRAFT_388221 [Lepidopterella palustris CBS 459.81]|uniref:Uncharacterized protein n=1 Tax=Lepidopterella palustris CBS 459.81 TaxID=1314670 RepID=A0A8E2JKI3_9PEZI|nr:hypothetical protein K432DRAFT_388221 [Lepidopterella palustris CBS 459.81]